MSIRPLPNDVVERISSSSGVTSLNHVVCGLLKNSLDANSTKVNIGLDFSLGNCVVEDDGLGIEPREFTQDGGLGRMHHTSKLPPSPTLHGSHGNFIASVAALSLLIISSCHHRHDTCSALTIHNGNVLARSIPAQPDQRLTTFGHGTRVSVRNLFGSMPVRVKQRGLLFSDHAKIDREWDAVTKELVALLLPWPGDVSVFVREANTQRQVRITGKGSDLPTRTSRLFLQVNLAESEDRGSWVPVSASSRRVRIKGVISTKPVATRRSQIICLGIRPVQNSFGTNVLYEEVNKIFKSSTFGIADANSADGVQEKLKKGVEKWPMFFLDLNVLGEDETMAGEDVVLGNSQHHLQAIIDLVRVVCYGFLKKHWMQPRHVQRSATNTKSARLRLARLPNAPLSPKIQTRLSSRARLAASEGISSAGSRYSPFESWHRTKVGKPLLSKSAAESHETHQPAENEEDPVKVPCRPVVGQDGMLLRKPFDDVDEAPRANQVEIQKQPPEANGSKTGTSPAKDAKAAPETASRRMSDAQASQPLKAPTNPQLQKWLTDILDTWENPVFETTEPRIPALSRNPDPVDRLVEVRGDGQRSRFFSQRNHVQFEAVSMNSKGRLSRRALDEARVIGQVDRKFILLQLSLRTSPDGPAPSETSSALVMLDQHAADERCRLEDLMSCYFRRTSHGLLQPVTEPLERPIVFEMSARENALLRRLHVHFQTWGIGLEHTVAKDAGAHEITVSRLPPTVLERCQSDPKLVIELVRKEIWKLEDGGTPLCPALEPGRSWVSGFHSCPDGILHLLHSRSCRSAIMFNDELSLDECERLVSRLSQCAFPFQCAHGRPSVVPLVDMGSGTGRLCSWSEGLSRPDAMRWREWLRGGI